MKRLIFLFVLFPLFAFAQFDGQGNFFAGNVFTTNVTESDKIGFNAAFAGSETVELTEDVWANVTNATNDFWTQLCGNGIHLLNDTIVVDSAGKWGGILSFSGTAGSGNDFEFRLYNVTTDAEVPFNVAYFSTEGNNNRASASVVICFCCATSCRLVFQIRNIDNNNDFTFVNSAFWIIRMMSATTCE